MGNRLSGLWCKKTATIHINNDSKQQEEQQAKGDYNTRNNNNNKSSRRKSGGAAGTFRLGSARRLSLTSCVPRDKTEKKTTNKLLPGSSAISTIEQQYEELLKTPAQPAQQSQTLPRAAKSAMKVDVKVPTVKVRVISVRADLQSTLWLCLWRLNLQFVALSVIICGSATEIETKEEMRGCCTC